MRAPGWLAAPALATALVVAAISPAAAAGTADILPKPSDRQQQVVDVLAKLNATIVPSREQFVAGSLRFAVYHELGHFLIDEYKIPVLGGREEDMADAYATFELAPSTAIEQMQAPVRMWLFYAYLRGAVPIEWWDEHSLDHQRAFQIACFLSGRWPDRYGGLSEAFGAPAERATTCAIDSHRTQAAWVETLRAQAAVLIDRQKAVVSYLLPTPQLADAERWLRASGLLESVAIEIERYKLPDWRIERRERLLKEWAEGGPGSPAFERTQHHVDVIAKSCGRANAFYAPPGDGPGLVGNLLSRGKTRRPQIIVCYELIDQFRILAQQGLPESGTGK